MLLHREPRPPGPGCLIGKLKVRVDQASGTDTALLRKGGKAAEALLSTAEGRAVTGMKAFFRRSPAFRRRQKQPPVPGAQSLQTNGKLSQSLAWRSLLMRCQADRSTYLADHRGVFLIIQATVRQ
jgi:hypothetical protein